jgi:site-specific DNA-methyltransferase (adenine-specific)
MEIQNIDGHEYLKQVENNSVDLILTDPPYIISHETGMNNHYNKVKDSEENNKNMKTVEDWEKYKQENGITDETNKVNYLKYGTVYGKKYCVQTNYGDWDSEFTMEMLDLNSFL